MIGFLNILKRQRNTTSSDRGPDFLIIGAQKSGTSALRDFLKQHPRIDGPEKEIHFFTSHFEKGEDWYHQQFSGLKEPQLIFEKTPFYLFHPEVPERIFSYNPKLKMIVILRNPVERAFSAWKHYQKYFLDFGRVKTSNLEQLRSYSSVTGMGEEFVQMLDSGIYPSFYDLCREEITRKNLGKFELLPAVVSRGIYAEQLKRFYQYFDRSQILILESNQLKNDLQTTMNRVFDFLQIPSVSIRQISLSSKNLSERVTISDTERQLLTDFYEPYNEALFDLIGERFDW